MGWSSSFSSSPAVGDSITFNPSVASASGGKAAYEVAALTAPKDGVYKFELYGSGGYVRTEPSTDGKAAAGGVGGKTTGRLYLKKGEVVYVGAGTPCAAAFVAKGTGTSLADLLTRSVSVPFIAGGAGGGGAVWGTSSNIKTTAGGNGGGASGGSALSAWDNTTVGVTGGTQGAGGSGSFSSITGTLGQGYEPGYVNEDNVSSRGGWGGDGYYGGGSGASGGTVAHGGGGGSGYVYAATTTANGKSYANTTTAGGGMASNTKGKVVVTYEALGLLPVWFNGVQLAKIYFNNVELEHLSYGGTQIYARIVRLLRRWRACLNCPEPGFA